MSSKLTFLALAIMILIVPAMAAPYPSGSYTDAESVSLTGVTNAHYNVTKGNAIGNVVFTVPIGTNITYTLGYGSSDTIGGEINYYGIGSELLGMEYSVNSYSRVSIGGNESSNTFWDVGGGLVNRYAITGHAIDEEAGTKGLAVWDTSVFNFYSADNVAYVPIDGIANKPIYSIDIVSDRPITIDISVGERTYIQTQASKTLAEVLLESIESGKQFANFVSGILAQGFTWLVFIYENIGLIIALYISLTGFMAFQKGKKNILRSIQIFFGYQRKLFETILALPYFIIDLADKIKSLVARWL